MSMLTLSKEVQRTNLHQKYAELKGADRYFTVPVGRWQVLSDGDT